MTLTISIQALGPEDWERVRSIYLEGIATGNATFREEAPDWPEWDTAHLAFSRFVARSRAEVLGWGALSPVSSRGCYSGVAEVSIYVAERARGRGVGSGLLPAVIADSESHGIWTVQAGIFPENTASVKLHTRAGFRVVGLRERLGCLKGRWRDVLLMERRSQRAGN